MLKIMICDDEKDIVERIEKLVQKYAKDHEMVFDIETFSRGEDLLFAFEEEGDHPDIIFLDVYMDGINGIETAEKIREMSMHPLLIFLTTSKDFVFDAFDVRSFHYLIKQEADDARIREVLDAAVIEVEQKIDDMFECNFGASKRSIPYKNIHYFEIYRRIMRVHYNYEESFDFYETMDNLASNLEAKGFLRIHRSYLVNMKHITLFETQSVRLSNGETLPIGKAYTKQVKEVFQSYLHD